jgi:hypothetical protein
MRTKLAGSQRPFEESAIRRDMEFVIGVLIALIGAIGGILLDRHFAYRDMQREIALELLRFTDNIWPWLRQALTEGRDQAEAQNEIDQRTTEVMSRVELLSSDDVLAISKAYEKAWLKAVDAVRRSGTEIEVAVSGMRNGLNPDRVVFVRELREALRQRPFGRRKKSA